MPVSGASILRGFGNEALITICLLLAPKLLLTRPSLLADTAPQLFNAIVELDKETAFGGKPLSQIIHALGPDVRIGRRCHELRIPDDKVSWRVVYRIDGDATVIVEVFSKKTGKTPKSIIDTCKARLREYDNE